MVPPIATRKSAAELSPRGAEARLHRELGVRYRASGYQGTYKEFLRSLGYRQGRPRKSAGAAKKKSRRR